MVTPVVECGEVCVWRESEVRRSVLCWFVSQDLVSVAVKICSGFIYFKIHFIVLYFVCFVKIMFQ
jgi:hypothetical protein